MKHRRTIGGLIGGAVIVLAFGGVPAGADEAGGEDPFAAVQVVGEGDLEALRGGDNNTIIESFNTTVTATSNNEVTASIGSIIIEVGGDILGGDVVISGNALSGFSGILTQAFATGPGNNVTATTAVTIMLVN